MWMFRVLESEVKREQVSPMCRQKPEQKMYDFITLQKDSWGAKSVATRACKSDFILS